MVMMAMKVMVFGGNANGSSGGDVNGDNGDGNLGNGSSGGDDWCGKPQNDNNLF